MNGVLLMVIVLLEVMMICNLSWSILKSHQPTDFAICFSLHEKTIQQFAQFLFVQ